MDELKEAVSAQPLSVLRCLLGTAQLPRVDKSSRGRSDHRARPKNWGTEKHAEEWSTEWSTLHTERSQSARVTRATPHLHILH